MLHLLSGEKALPPIKYYTLLLPRILKKEISELSICRQNELQALSKSQKINGSYNLFVSGLFERMIPDSKEENKKHENLNELLKNHGFNSEFHDTIKTALKSGQIGLAQNRLRSGIKITDSSQMKLQKLESNEKDQIIDTGEKAIQNGELAIITLAGGVGSRWTKGAGVVKSLHPFSKFGGKHRNFIDLHLAKNQKTAKKYNKQLPHIFTTSYLTHQPIKQYLDSKPEVERNTSVLLSPGQFIGLRFIPPKEIYDFIGKNLSQQMLDEQAQKMRESLHNALINWAKSNGEGENYTDNLASTMYPSGWSLVRSTKSTNQRNSGKIN